MTVVELCSGTAPASRASAFLALSSYSIDYRANQTKTAASLCSTFFTTMSKFLDDKEEERPVS